MWRKKRKYDFTYDKANRLLTADFNQYTSSSFSKAAGVDFSVSNMSYDANGNILSMTQKGLKINTSPVIDYLSYTYASHSNKLLQVADTANNFTSLLGDFKYNASTKTSTDYTYNANGSITTDKNKNISDIQYNYLNLVSEVEKPTASGQVYGGGRITYEYDAAGNKVSKEVYDNWGYMSATTTTTSYICGFVYESKNTTAGGWPQAGSYTDSLLYTGHEEGRIRKKGNSFVYDYFIKDHLGNVRMVLTEEQQTDMYPAATMETATATTEETYYSNLPATRIDAPTGYPANTPSGNAKVAKVRGDGNKIGPAMILKVMAGDTMNLTVNSWWKSTNTPGTPVSPLTDLLNALNSNVGGVAGSHADAGGLASTNVLNAGTTNFLTNQSYNSSKPKAFINWILFDEQFNYVSSNSGFEQVGATDTYTTHTRTNEAITKSGYLYIYVSNETPNIDVFFDNLQVTHKRGPLLQEEHYYPFGLSMSGISSKALSFGKENHRKFNGGVELDRDFGMDLYKCFFRQYDPQIGRFMGIDILSELEYDATVYQFAGNNPIAFNDPLGDRTKYMDQNGTLWSLPGLFRTAFDTHKNQFTGNQFDWRTDGGGGGGGWGGGMKITAAMVLTYYQRYWAGTERWNIGASDSPNGNGFNVGFSTDPIQTMDNIVIAYSSYAKMEKFLFGGGNGNNWDNVANGAELALGTWSFSAYNNAGWFSYKKAKWYSPKFNGNGATGGRLKHAGLINRGLKRIGYGFSAMSVIETSQKMSSGEYSDGRGLIELGAIGYSTFGAYGWAFAIGWEGGRFITSREWYKEFKAHSKEFFGLSLDHDSRRILQTEQILAAEVPTHY